ncbi:hypothetical protein GT204_07905 [Streptomyces sp. SID4919]|uniref:DUF7426 family protein n=1 Tax=unclassified Streptomyces TaxID=2593676 RepID=UPI000823A53A|nr:MULTISPECIES: hypothetical protein [unclassified Streptomyces]MYY08829.1 hypothetical protein [Streptomyces sp. SID4919]SCK25611.1 hypothetical protein YW7DRAFT_01965 [Streptomyces sp. AmelKG-E11A]
MSALKFEALEELFDDALELPVKGKTYKIPSPSAEDGLKIQRITTMAARLVDGGEAVDTDLLDDDEETDLIRLCLGPVYDDLLADGVDWAWLRHAGLTAMFWITAGADAAMTYWAAAGDPSRLAPNRETRRKKAQKSGSAAAKSTRTRGSTNGTKGRPATGSGPQAGTI